MKLNAQQLKALGINCIANDKPDIVTDFSRLQAEVNRLSEANILFAQDNLKLREEIETLETRHAAVMLHTQSVVDEHAKLREVVKAIAESPMLVRGVAKLWMEWCREVIKP